LGDVAGSNPTGSTNANMASISQSQASAPTPVTKPAFKNAPSASGILASAPSAHVGQPEHPFSPVGAGRQQLLYDVNHGEVPTQDEFYGSSRNDDFYGQIHNNDRNARFVTGRSKGKGKPSKSKGMRNAVLKDWDPNMTTIPEFGSSLGIKFFSLSETLSGMTDYPVKKTEVFKRATQSSIPIYYLGGDDTRMRCLPKDLDVKGNPTIDIQNQYNHAQRAIYDVQQSCLHFVLTQESAPYRNVNLDGKPIAKGFKSEVHALLEEHQKQSLGDYWSTGGC
jgi:hypothetical protein